MIRPEPVSHERKRGGEQGNEDGPEVQPRGFEADDEGEEVDGERGDPEERNGGDVRGEVRRNGEEKHRSAGGEAEPDQADAETGSGTGIVIRGFGGGDGFAGGCFPRGERADGGEADEAA